MEKPRDVYLEGCAFIAEVLASDGFRYASSKQQARRSRNGFDHLISFQSSHSNIADHSVAFWIHANLRSKGLREWRAQQPRALRTDDFCAGGQIGNLRDKATWMAWNLADPPTRRSTLADAVATIEHIALPFFSLFDDVATLADCLVTRTLPGFEPEITIEFLLCFATREHAATYLARFFVRRFDLIEDYLASLAQMRRDGLPPYRPNGFASVLAAATLAYELPPAAQ
ncbi:MAG: DUF4304 domain-containing protein [Bradymonadia bacterium]